MDWIAYQLPVLVNEYLEFSRVNGFASAIFIKQSIAWESRLTTTLKMYALLQFPIW